jgi:1,2-phenylacetyl-CoA epoxidase PaaB subunit
MKTYQIFKRNNRSEEKQSIGIVHAKSKLEACIIGMQKNQNVFISAKEVI